MKQKKVPMRMCLGCQEMKPKRELIRVVKDKDGSIAVDFKGKQPGRGAYICRSTVCFEKARKAKKFERAFESQISGDIYDTLHQQLEESNDE